MRIEIDTALRRTVLTDNGERRELPLYSKASFELLSSLWLKVGWNEKYAYTFTWLGRPVIQLPEDMVRIQEVIWRVKPDVIVETGVAHGGSLIFYASLCKAMSRGRVVGIDIEIRPENRAGIESHPLAKRISLIEGSSTSPEVLARVNDKVNDDDRVVVILDSCHTREHVLAELRTYAPLVSVDSYIVATDGVMRHLHDVPRGEADWREDNPAAAAELFAQEDPKFELQQPEWAFNESELTKNLTYWPSAYLRRIRA